MKEDFSMCDPGVKISISYEYEISSPVSLERTDLYLFDAEGRFVVQQSEQNIVDGSTTVTHTLRIPSGNYTAVAWGNLSNSVKVTPTNFVVGHTTLDQARLSLAEFSAASKANNITHTTGPEKVLLHAIIRNIHVRWDKQTHITMPLSRNTKHINVSVRFIDADGNVCDHTNHHLNTTIGGRDGILNFENSLLSCPSFLYTPAAETNIAGGFDASFRKMRLFMGESSDIIFTNPNAAIGNEPFYRKSLMTLLDGTGYNSQQELDQTHVYNLEFRFRCDDWNTTHVTARIFVNGWEYVEMGGDV
ncbi:MAG: FimB/Mfa2 family fimbrial subunit [Rikenellaceae bacterium]